MVVGRSLGGPRTPVGVAVTARSPLVVVSVTWAGRRAWSAPARAGEEAGAEACAERAGARRIRRGCACLGSRAWRVVSRAEVRTAVSMPTLGDVSGLGGVDGLAGAGAGGGDGEEDEASRRRFDTKSAAPTRPQLVAVGRVAEALQLGDFWRQIIARVGLGAEVVRRRRASGDGGRRENGGRHVCARMWDARGRRRDGAQVSVDDCPHGF